MSDRIEVNITGQVGVIALGPKAEVSIDGVRIDAKPQGGLDYQGRSIEVSTAKGSDKVKPVDLPGYIEQAIAQEQDRLGKPAGVTTLVKSRPPIVTLCGSTRFKAEYEELNALFTLAGVMVFSVGFYGHQSAATLWPEQKTKIDQLHFSKIAESDFIYVIDKDRYIGESTRNEITLATILGKPVYFFSVDYPKGLERYYSKPKSEVKAPEASYPSSKL
jgi:phage pi2 protein 07